MNTEERLEQLEFEIELLFSNTSIDRFIFEQKITKRQYNQINDYMESINNKLINNGEINKAEFEIQVEKIIPNKCYNIYRSLAKLFAENDKYKEVYSKIYCS